MMYSPDDLDALDGHPFDPDRPVSREVLASSARDGVLRPCCLCGHPVGDHTNGDFDSLPVAAGEVQCGQCGGTTNNAVELRKCEWVDGDPVVRVAGYACSPECFVALLPNAVDPGRRRFRLARLRGCKTDGDDELHRLFGSTNNTTDKEN